MARSPEPGAVEGGLRFERESWRKLYIVESAEHRLMPIFSRGLRDYLLRLAGDDGTILSRSTDPKSDLQLLLGARSASDRTMISNSYDDLLRVGYLSFEGGRLWITRFAEAQEARSPGAKRQATYRKNHPSGKASQPSQPTDADVASRLGVTSDVTSNASSNAPVTSQIDETRRDETRTPNPAAADSVAAKARKVLDNPYDGAWLVPSKWPEVEAICRAWSFGMPIKLGDSVNRDSDLRAILEAIAAQEHTVEQLILAGDLAKKSEYFGRLTHPGPASFTAPVLRRLLAPDTVAVAAGIPAGIKFGTEGL